MTQTPDTDRLSRQSLPIAGDRVRSPGGRTGTVKGTVWGFSDHVCVVWDNDEYLNIGRLVRRDALTVLDGGTDE